MWSCEAVPLFTCCKARCAMEALPVFLKKEREQEMMRKKKGVLHLMLSCQVAICAGSIVPLGTSCVGCSGDDERPGGSGRHGILLPTAVGDSVAFRIPDAKRKWNGARCRRQPLFNIPSTSTNVKARESILTVNPRLRTHN